jgi:hypothetical protein
MRGGHDGERIATEPVVIETTRRYERRQLERLGGRSQEDELVGISGRRVPLARWRDDRDRASMA